MSRTVGINPPKTACTTEPRGMAKCTIPNVCKMPGPPAPFVPAPLPNIGKSNLSPKGYTTTVKLEGKTVAIRGATFESIGDMASKGTGGGLISANCHGPTKFITPGSMNVKMEGKAVQLLGEPMLNNCGPSGSPPNTGATMAGFDTYDQGGDPKKILEAIAKQCSDEGKKKAAKEVQQKKKRTTCQKLGQEQHKCCDDKIKEGIEDHKKKHPDGKPPAPLEGEKAYNRPKFKKGKPVQPIDKNPVNVSRGDAIQSAIAEATKANPGLKGKAMRKAIGKAIGKKLSGLVFPDAAIVGPPKIMVDFKFACPASHRSKKKSTAKNYKPPKQSKSQEDAHTALGDAPTITIQF